MKLTLSLLLVLFVALKLLGYITWSWIVVLLPAWIGLASVVLIFILALMFAVVSDSMGGKRKK